MKYSVTLQQNFKCITVQKTCMSRKQKSFRWILTTSRERRSSNTILVSVLKCMRQASWQLWWNTIKSKFLVQWNYKGSTSSKWDGGLGVGGSGGWGAINVFVSDKVTWNSLSSSRRPSDSLSSSRRPSNSPFSSRRPSNRSMTQQGSEQATWQRWGSLPSLCIWGQHHPVARNAHSHSGALHRRDVMLSYHCCLCCLSRHHSETVIMWHNEMLYRHDVMLSCHIYLSITQ